jgi:hypothetical protein
MTKQSQCHKTAQKNKIIKFVFLSLIYPPFLFHNGVLLAAGDLGVVLDWGCKGSEIQTNQTSWETL